ncbi:MAG: leucyl/phenylalanyl-tRNA--protein transferase [Bacteroidia bacterium]|nr:leucyl/phenylalanyl-tRNA--protein transferase [Bacteroidia bacterium]
MPVFYLSDKNIFPDPNLAEPDGLLAIGGDLSVERLLVAYASGIFPWYSQNTPILWWSLDPRMVLFPDELKISKSLRQTLRQHSFKISMDSCFEDVIKHCSSVPRPQKGTWLTKEMVDAYNRLHNAGFAHSVEVWDNNKLAGGLYGVSIGRAFFGESMFYLQRDASKVALYHLCKKLIYMDFQFIDAQQTTKHIMSLGAVKIPRKEYLQMLNKALEYSTLIGKWTD